MFSAIISVALAPLATLRHSASLRTRHESFGDLVEASCSTLTSLLDLLVRNRRLAAL